MTQGKWVQDPSGFNALDIGVIDKEKYNGGFLVVAGMNPNFMIEAKSNATAIVSSVNNTWGAGYDPASMLEFMRAFEEYKDDPTEGRYDELLEILTSAKI